MKVALLVCDHVGADLVPIYGDYPAMFRRLLPDLSMDPWFVCDGQFPEINDYDAFICTGSKYSVYDDIRWIKDLLQFTLDIFDAGKKLVGSCFGHQMIAYALNGSVTKSDRGYLIGIHSFELAEQPAWLSQYTKSFNILMLCQDQVTKLPPNSKVWASAEACPVGMYTVGTHFLGIQGHPEFTKGFNQAVFESRSDKIGHDKVQRAIESLDKDPDRAFFSMIIMDFLQ